VRRGCGAALAWRCASNRSFPSLADRRKKARLSQCTRPVLAQLVGRARVGVICAAAAEGVLSVSLPGAPSCTDAWRLAYCGARRESVAAVKLPQRRQDLAPSVPGFGG
jgi:hypothetical protein